MWMWQRTLGRELVLVLERLEVDKRRRRCSKGKEEGANRAGTKRRRRRKRRNVDVALVGVLWSRMRTAGRLLVKTETKRILPKDLRFRRDTRDFRTLKIDASGIECACCPVAARLCLSSFFRFYELVSVSQSVTQSHNRVRARVILLSMLVVEWGHGTIFLGGGRRCGGRGGRKQVCLLCFLRLFDVYVVWLTS